MIAFGVTAQFNYKKLDVTVEASGYVYRELYGADADGNRGEWRTGVDDLEIKVLDYRGNDITEKVKSRYVRQWQKIEERAIAELIDLFY